MNRIYQAYRLTPMALSSGTPGGGMIQEQFDKAEFRHDHSSYRYRVQREPGAYSLELERTNSAKPIRARRALSYFIGSGSLARSFLWQLDGFFYQSPVAYYTRDAK